MRSRLGLPPGPCRATLPTLLAAGFLSGTEGRPLPGGAGGWLTSPLLLPRGFLGQSPLWALHTCAHTHTQVTAYYTHAGARALMHMHTCTHMHMHTCASMHPHTCMHVHTRPEDTHMHTLTHAHMHVHMHVNTCAREHSCTHIHMCTHERTHPRVLLLPPLPSFVNFIDLSQARFFVSILYFPLFTKFRLHPGTRTAAGF